MNITRDIGKSQHEVHEKYQSNFHRECISKCFFEPRTGIRCCYGRTSDICALPLPMKTHTLGAGHFVELKFFSRVKINAINWPALDVWFLIALQLIKYCSANEEAPKAQNFFFGPSLL